MEERIRIIGRTAWWLVGITVALGIVLMIGWWTRVIIPPLVLAGAITFLLNPVVTKLHDRGLPRLVGTAVAYAAVVGLVVLAGFAIAPIVQDQVSVLSEEWPEVRADVEDRINELSEESVEKDWPITIPSVKDIEDEVGNGDGNAGTADLGDQVSSLGKFAGRVFHIGLIFILGPIIAFYLLMDLPHIRRVTEEMIPEHAREEVLTIAHRLNLAVGGFFRGQLAVAVIVGIMVSLGLLAIGLPAWLIVGMIAGLFNMVPLIGPYVGAVPGIVVALTQRDLKTALLVVVVMTAAQQIDNHFVSPVVMKRAVQLHPAAVMMALLLGGTLAGFFGLLIAVPLAASLKIICGHLWRKYVLGQSIPGLDQPLPVPATTAATGGGHGSHSPYIAQMDPRNDDDADREPGAGADDDADDDPDGGRGPDQPSAGVPAV